MSNDDFRRYHADHHCYYKSFDDNYIILLLYMDDMFVSRLSIHEINNLKNKLSNKFEIKDLGATKQILGMKIAKDRKTRTLKLSQLGIC